MYESMYAPDLYQLRRSMDARDLIQLRRQWIMEDLNSSPSSSPPHAFIENDDDHWMFPQPTSNQDFSRVRLSGPELARINENFAEIDAKISKALFQAEQRKWAAICKRRSKLQNEIMLTEEKNQLDLKAALPSVARSQSAGAAPTTAALIPFHQSMLDVDSTEEERDHSKDREASKEDLRDKREDRLKGGKIREEMGRSSEEENAAVGKKRKITGRKYRDISEIVAEVMEARKAMEMEGIPI